MFQKAIVCVLAVAGSVSALATPHAGRSSHHALAARIASPAALDISVPAVLPVKKRSSNRKCRQRSSTTTKSSTSATHTSSSTAVGAVGNVGGDPDTTTTTHSHTTTQAHTTTTQQAPPTTTTHHTTTKTTSSKASSTTHSSGNSGGDTSGLPSFMVGTQTGQGTYYDTGLVACGGTFTNNDKIVAVSHSLFDAFPGYNGANPNNNPVCGRSITATYQGRSVTVTVQDRCTGCQLTDLDFTPSALKAIDPNYETDGRISGVKWVWN